MFVDVWNKSLESDSYSRESYYTHILAYPLTFIYLLVFTITHIMKLTCNQSHSENSSLYNYFTVTHTWCDCVVVDNYKPKTPI